MSLKIAFIASSLLNIILIMLLISKSGAKARISSSIKRKHEEEEKEEKGLRKIKNTLAQIRREVSLLIETVALKGTIPAVEIEKFIPQTKEMIERLGNGNMNYPKNIMTKLAVTKLKINDKLNEISKQTQDGKVEALGYLITPSLLSINSAIKNTVEAIDSL
ncbi:MAG: hypothetical protein COS99_07365 [Candidatus Omnitrophica bacterium CG07_land_8_20_14_0_80_42_15]|uniref:Uncharacterized protein n=1 Tax=Candidatus Aquitaenariimonas noxiae TaxID=1974741 RepID=A0A2J0KTP0_9BACT|nr:MAG: hypothetical protein COS99_07365 [Candidatus Omnitrophica bacterium CG07_land_8_20_14_0_80_42_15]